MKKLNQDKLKKIISVFLLIGWCFLIFSLSNRNGTLSTNDSDLIINLLGNLGVYLKNSLHLNITLIIRKLAHIFLYFILYLLIFNVMWQFKIKKQFLFSFIFCFLYAISDEIHQMFILNRSAEVLDVLIDMIGVIFQMIILYGIFKKCEKKHIE